MAFCLLAELVCLISHADRFVWSLRGLVHAPWSVCQSAVLQEASSKSRTHQAPMDVN